MRLRISFWLAFGFGLVTPFLVWRVAHAQPSLNPHADISIDCGACHTPQGWKPVSTTPSFKHEATGFVLREAHAQATCRGCHRSLVFSRVGTACADCHRDAHRGDLGSRCEDCHDQRSWSNQGQMRERHNRSRFPLIGVHANPDCDSCHRGPQAGQYSTVTTSCNECHEQSYLRARSPNHVAGRYSKHCEGCHTLFGWRPATGIDHNTTRFPLTGAHLAVLCARCHIGGRTTGTASDCLSCHQSNYNATTNPSHTAANYPRTCQDCHSTTAWRPAANIDHNKTRFPLTGAHQGQDCARCHVGGRFAGTPTDCLSCHQANYSAATSPNHATGGYPTTCQDCHSTSAWRPASAIDHSKTRFPLTGAHQGTDCVRCHVGGRFAGTPTDCVSCHQTNYDATTNPNHRASGFPTDCQSCHTTATWLGAVFDHSRFFPITSGRHRGIACATCHTNSANYAVFSCLNGCHARSSTDNEHRGTSGYIYDSAACYRCHPRGSED